MRLVASILALLCVLVAPQRAAADPADIDAAARGVVRVIILGRDGEEIFPVSHGTGFAVAPDTVVTNAHVVGEALEDTALRIGIVPANGGDPVYGSLVAVSPRNDLALIRLTGTLRLPPLALAGGTLLDSGDVTAVGYPANVDQAQGLEVTDLFRAQPPVKSRGSISGSRPSRQFATILHTAPIARGNSGGPLLDECGRVVGVNSFGADGEGADAEFFFAVANSELAPFLEAQGVKARVNALPCRSLAELDAADRARLEAEEAAARADLAQQAETARAKADRALLEAEQAVLMEREDRIALAFLLVLGAIGLGVASHRTRQQDGFDIRRANGLAAGSAVLAVAAIALYLARPGLDEIDRRVAAAMMPDEPEALDAPRDPAATTAYQCTLDTARSRVTSADAADLGFEWSNGGCINGRTQYGVAGGDWSRVFVPNDEDAVSVNRFDPQSGEYRAERYLLGREAMIAAREARAKYQAPVCGSEDAASTLGAMQADVLGQLPQRPNERLVYDCAKTR